MIGNLLVKSLDWLLLRDPHNGAIPPGKAEFIVKKQELVQIDYTMLSMSQAIEALRAKLEPDSSFLLVDPEISKLEVNRQGNFTGDVLELEVLGYPETVNLLSEALTAGYKPVDCLTAIQYLCRHYIRGLTYRTIFLNDSVLYMMSLGTMGFGNDLYLRPVYGQFSEFGTRLLVTRL